MAREEWIFPIAEGICVDEKNGRWSDAVFFDEEDILVEWHQAEPAPHVQDREVWRRCLEFLETSPYGCGDPADSRKKPSIRASADVLQHTADPCFNGGNELWRHSRIIRKLMEPPI